MSLQQTLFRLPTALRYEPTQAQLEMLDLVALYENEPLAEPLYRYRFQGEVLRRMIRADLVECVSYQPARYKLTPRGRLVRARGRP